MSEIHKIYFMLLTCNIDCKYLTMGVRIPVFQGCLEYF
jgi:hypothetical protein